MGCSVHQFTSSHLERSTLTNITLQLITKMPSLRKFTPLVLLAAMVDAAFGPYFSTGPTASGVYIYSSTATVTLPNSPNGAGSGYDLSLWVGMGTSLGDLVQSITDNFNSGWSVYAYTLKSTGPNSQEVIQGPSKSAKAGDVVRVDCKFGLSPCLGMKCRFVFLTATRPVRRYGQLQADRVPQRCGRVDVDNQRRKSSGLGICCRVRGDQLRYCCRTP